MKITNSYSSLDPAKIVLTSKVSSGCIKLLEIKDCVAKWKITSGSDLSKALSNDVIPVKSPP